MYLIKLCESHSGECFFTKSSPYDRPRAVTQMNATVFENHSIAHEAMKRLYANGQFSAHIVPQVVETQMVPSKQHDETAPSVDGIDDDDNVLVVVDDITDDDDDDGILHDDDDALSEATHIRLPTRPRPDLPATDNANTAMDLPTPPEISFADEQSTPVVVPVPAMAHDDPVPRDLTSVLSDLAKLATEQKAHATEIANTGTIADALAVNTAMTVSNAATHLHDLLKSGDVLSFKNAQVFMTSLHSVILNQFPDTVKLHLAGANFDKSLMRRFTQLKAGPTQ